MNHTVQNDRSKLRQFVATFAVLVLVVFATAEVVHAHVASNASPNESHCSLCIAAHSVAAPAQASIAPVTFDYLILHLSADPQLRSRLAIPSAFIRPPPASL